MNHDRDIYAEQSGALSEAVRDLERNPLLGHLSARQDLIARALEANVAQTQWVEAAGSVVSPFGSPWKSRSIF